MWMFDRAVCSRMVLSSQPHACWDALLDLPGMRSSERTSVGGSAVTSTSPCTWSVEATTGAQTSNPVGGVRQAIITWMRQSFELARQESLPGVVVVIHANPRWERFNRGDPNSSFSAFLEALYSEAEAFDGPVLLLHGDTHTFRVDKPLSNRMTGEMLTNFTRVETFGHPNMHWVLITASSEDVDRFDIQPMIVKQNRP